MIEREGVVEAEASGETVGEAKWQAVRELERLHPGIDRDCVTFEVVSEGERGLLGVGTTPARVRARAELADGSSDDDGEEPSLAALVREVLGRIATGVGVSGRVVVTEAGDSVRATVAAPAADVGLLIGRNGRTIDAVQYVVSAIAQRAEGEGRVVEVDAGGYRGRRQERLATTARSAAERALRTGEAVALAPMTAMERKIVHTELHGVAGVETRSEGEEPNRSVVVAPATGEG